MKKMQLHMCRRTLNFKRFMKSHAPWPILITSAWWTFSRWMVYIFIYDSPFSNHNISYKLDKLSSHLTRSKANINCSKGHSIQLCSILNCHHILTAISSITHLTRMFWNLEIHCLSYGKKKQVNKTQLFFFIFKADSSSIKSKIIFPKGLIHHLS